MSYWRHSIKPETSEKKLGLPRPIDYDDYWYEAEDGLWYNEYDDELEGDQFYEEVPEEDGYPKPDLSAVEQLDTFEEEQVEEEPVPPPPTMKSENEQSFNDKKTQDQAKDNAELDNDIKAAQEAAKAAGDAAKNLLGGAMNFGGGLLGGLGAKQSQKQQSFGMGVFGLGSISPQQKQADKKEPMKTKPVIKKQGAFEKKEEETEQIHVKEEKPDHTTKEKLKAEVVKKEDAKKEVVKKEEVKKEDVKKEDDKLESKKEESLTDNDENKKSVTFKDSMEEKKVRDERHINKTRTMRPKEKWEWAFTRIMNRFEVRVII